MPKVSVVIPCYNQGQFLDEAVASILAQTYQDFEIIVVNDGSTDEVSTRILRAFDKPRTKVIHTANQGLPSARNNGIAQASGKYILPLDADDKIADTYMEKAVAALDDNANLGIVYCEAEFFGARTGKWEMEEYGFPKILLGNMIFCAGFYRRSDWEKVNGYDPAMKLGFEDYEFWVALACLGREVYRIPEVLFFYRQRPPHLNTPIPRDKLIYYFSAIFRKHAEMYMNHIEAFYDQIISLKEKVERFEEELGNRAANLEMSKDSRQ